MDNSITSYGLKNVDTKRWRLAPLNLFCVTVLRVPCWRGLWRREGIIQIFNLTMSPEKWQKHHHVESHSYFLWLDRSLSWLAATTPCLSWCFSLWWLYDCFAPGCSNDDWNEKEINRCKAVREALKNVLLGIFPKQVDPPSSVYLGIMWILAKLSNENVNFVAKNNGHHKKVNRRL